MLFLYLNLLEHFPQIISGFYVKYLTVTIYSVNHSTLTL